MQIKDCCYERTAEAILEIFNDAILNSTALYDYEARSLEQMADWFHGKIVGGWPVLGAFDEENTLLGFATYGPFRNYPANRYTVEHSVYIHKSHRGKGVGRALLQCLIEEARQQEYHVMVGSIDASNQASIQLHESFGFFHAGTLRHAGFKFGRWLDLAFYELILDTPAHPVVV